MKYQKFSLIYGFLIWLLSTLAFSLAGHHFFLIENKIVMTSFYIGVIPVLYFLILPVFKKFKLYGNESLLSVVLMATPGIVLDTFCIKYHELVFPTLSVAESIALGSWVLWVYAIVLVIGLRKALTPSF